MKEMEEQFASMKLKLREVEDNLFSLQEQKDEMETEKQSQIDSLNEENA